MKKENTIYVEKLDDGSYQVNIKRSRKELLKDIFSGDTTFVLSPEEAKVLSNVLYTPKKKVFPVKKKKKAVPPPPPCE